MAMNGSRRFYIFIIVLAIIGIYKIIDNNHVYKTYDIDKKDSNITVVQNTLLAKFAVKRMVSSELSERYTYSSVNDSRDKLMQRISFDLPEGCKVESKCDVSEVDGSKIYTFYKNDKYERVALYVHGGGFAFDADPAHVSLADKTALSTNSKVIFPCYPLTPKYTYKETFALLSDIYESMLKEGKEIILMGDSSGADIVFSFTQHLKKQGIKKPDKLVLISPLLDAALSNPKISMHTKTDAMLDVKGYKLLAGWWAGGLDLADPVVSPINGDISGLPKTLIVVASNEIFFADARLLYDKMKANGSYVKMVIGNGLFHLFPLAGKMPQGSKAQRLIFKFIEN